MKPGNAITALLTDIVCRGGNRTAVVWVSAALGKAHGLHATNPAMALVSLKGVRPHAAKLGVAKRLDEIMAAIEQQATTAPQAGA